MKIRFLLILTLLLAPYVFAEEQAKIKIVVSIQPIAEVVKAVGGDSVDVTVLIRPGESPHHFVPKPRQIELLKKADLVVMNGAGLDDWIAKHFEDGDEKLIRWDLLVKQGDVVEHHDFGAAKNKKPIRCTIISDAAGRQYAKIAEQLMKAKALSGIQMGIDEGGKEVFFDADDNLGNPKHGEFYFPVVEDDHETHLHVERDPHFWLNPKNMMLLNFECMTELCGDPEQDNPFTLKFMERAQKLTTRLQQLDSNYKKFFESSQMKVVTYHDAFKHLQARYGFDLKSVSNSHHGHEVSPKWREEIVQFLKKEKIKTLFVERDAQRRDLQWIVERSGVKTRVLDPNIYPGVQGYATYFEMMESNLRALQSAN